MSEGRFSDFPDWVWDLSKQEAQALRALAKAYPKPVSDVVLNGSLTPKDHVAADRCGSFVPLVIHRLRRKLPAGGIERVRLTGYRLTPEARAQL